MDCQSFSGRPVQCEIICFARVKSDLSVILCLQEKFQETCYARVWLTELGPPFYRVLDYPFQRRDCRAGDVSIPIGKYGRRFPKFPIASHESGAGFLRTIPLHTQSLETNPNLWGALFGVSKWSNSWFAALKHIRVITVTYVLLTLFFSSQYLIFHFV